MSAPRVILGMSGGVDSSVAAFLLREAGYAPVGVTLKLLPGEVERLCAGGAGYRVCCSSEAVEEAREAALAAGIPHYVLDGRDRFARDVIAPFVSDYGAGRTPNPCTLCNRAVKFAMLLEAAATAGAAHVATGHYARAGRLEGAPCVLRGIDDAKDQSYMLALLPPETVARLVLPLGDLTKAESRARAEALGLSTAGKPDSQDICFVPGGDYRAFLARRDPPVGRPGRIVDPGGRELGRHGSHVAFTVGQRRGLGIAHPHPLYVVSVSADGTVVVGPERLVFSRALRVAPPVVRHPAFRPPLDCLVQIRARHAPEPARVEEDGAGGLRVAFPRRVRAVAPGQTAAFYLGDFLVAGGVIDEAGG